MSPVISILVAIVGIFATLLLIATVIALVEQNKRLKRIEAYTKKRLDEFHKRIDRLENSSYVSRRQQGANRREWTDSELRASTRRV